MAHIPTVPSMNSQKKAQEHPHTGFLHVIDSRSHQSFDIPIQDNVVLGADLAKIKIQGSSGNAPKPLKVLDPGLANVAVKQSRITDSTDEGLTYRGHLVSSLVDNHDFEDVVYLLLFEHLPSASERSQFQQVVCKAAHELPSCVSEVVNSLPRDAPHQSLLIAALNAALCAGMVETTPGLNGDLYKRDLATTNEAICRVIGIYSACLGLVFCHKKGQPVPSVDPSKPLTYNILKQTSIINDPRTGEPDEQVLKVLERFFINSADHELAHSTASFLLASSAQQDPLSSVISALSAGYAPLHLGAVDGAYHTIQKIGTKENVAAALEEFKNKKSRLSGIGHAVYKDVDRRVPVTKGILADMKALGYYDPLSEISEEIERQVLIDPWFTERKLCVNPDLYWKYIWTSLGVPVTGLVPIFYMARLAGLMAHYREAMTQTTKIWRPRQVYVGRKANAVPESKL